MNEKLRLGQALIEYIKPGGHRLAVLEETKFCNRRCPYCEVPRKFNSENELTLEETKRVIDRLYALTLSLHSYSKKALESLCEKAVATAKRGILPIISTVFTQDRVRIIPGIANYVTNQGIFFGVGICQSHGGHLSPECPELVPTLEQQKYVFEALLQLKPYGLIRTNKNYLRRAPIYYPNSWKCDPSKDTFIHIGSSGTLDVCTELKTGLSVANIKTLKDESWRKIKTAMVRNCGGCLNYCYFELENRGLLGDIPTAMMMGFVVSGKSDFVKKWGEITSKRVVISQSIY